MSDIMWGRKAGITAWMLLMIAALAGCAGGTSDEAAGAARNYTDAAGREVMIPVQPERVVVQQFYAEMLTVGAPMIGTNKSAIGQTVLDGMLEDVEDIGNIFAMSFEKIVELNPDLIIVPDYVEGKIVDELTKIAPTVVVNYGESIFSRVRAIGDLFGKSDKAEEWIASYEEKVAAARQKLKEIGGEDETVSAFILFNDKELYVYGKQMIGATLYDSLGFKPAPKIQEMIDKDESMLWEQLSMEVLPEYAGDRIIFILPFADKDTQAEADRIFDTALWQTIPAVKNGKVHVLDMKWSFYDPITMTKLIEELPALLGAEDAS